MTRNVLAGIVAGVLLAAPITPARAQQAPPAAARAAALDINTATVADLEGLPGVGRRTAERIVEHRQKNGAFKKIEELMNVKGIGEKSFLKLKPLIAVSAKGERTGGAR